MITLLIFGALYTLIARQFYHGTSQYEPALGRDRRSLCIVLTQSMRNQFRRGNRGDIARVEDWRVNADELSITDVKVGEDALVYRLWLTLHRSGPTGPEAVQLVTHTNVTVPLRPNRIGDVAGPHTLFVLPQVEPVRTGIGDPTRIDAVIPRTIFPSTAFGIPATVPVMELSDDAVARMAAYYNGMRGFPADSSGRWIRMFHLSAMTITTVGYGDVVPLSDLARALVAAEAILGIAIIGLFLNACARAADSQ